MMRDEKLANCPFCQSSQAEIFGTGKHWDDEKRALSEPLAYMVRHRCLFFEEGWRIVECVGATRESAIAAWNRRASPSGDLAEAREALEKTTMALEQYVSDFGSNEDADSRLMAIKARDAIRRARQALASLSRQGP